jgi:hypothetical protein
MFRDAIVPLSLEDAASALAGLGEKFVSQPHSSWWWEHIREGLKQTAYSPPDGDGYRLLPALCPDKSVLFFVSDDESPPWPAFRGAPHDLSRAAAECPAFEYVVADPDGAWLLMENHHGLLVAVGEPVATALAAHDG